MSSIMHATKKAARELVSSPAMPLGISRLNCEALCGLTERQLYDLGRTHKLPRLPGKIPVYRADAVLALFTSDAVAAGAAENTNDDAMSADAVLASIGRRRTGAR